MLYKSIQNHVRNKGGGDLHIGHITQSAPDIHRKLPKLLTKGSKDLDLSVCTATSVYLNKNLEEKRNDLEKEKKEMNCCALGSTPLSRFKPVDLFPIWTGWPFQTGVPPK
jgi:hypothetical protein